MARARGIAVGAPVPWRFPPTVPPRPAAPFLTLPTAWAAAPAEARPCRVALYSHDTMGMGHIRRNLLIAQALARPPLTAGLLCISGAHEATASALPVGIDCITLPALRKEERGRRYRARRLPLAARELIELRAQTIAAALDAFDPDVLIVDKVPCGLLGELEPALDRLRAAGRTRFVLGLRDVLDEPAVVRREWHEQGNEAAIARYYDAVWVYGDPAVYDMVQEYDLSAEIAGKVRYTGYLDQRVRLEPANGAAADDALADVAIPSGRLVVCLVGSGEDGGQLAEAFALAELPAGTSTVIVAGPLMPAAARAWLHQCAEQRPRVQVLDSVAEPGLLLRRANAIVAMGGYNTACEVLSYGTRALLVPRVRPRLEQMIRAERLRDLGMLDVLHPDELTPAALSRWLAHDAPAPAAAPPSRIDLQGLERIPHLLAELLAAPRARPVLTAETPNRGGVFACTQNRRASDTS